MESGRFNPSTLTYQTAFLTSPSIPQSSALSLPHFILSFTPSPPSKPAFIDAITGEVQTYSSLAKHTISIANAFKNLGIKKGDVVLFLSQNSIHIPALSLASLTTDLTPIGTQILKSDTAALMYSSGTTGKSKGVRCSHENLITAAAVLQHVWKEDGGSSAMDVYACVVPLFHMFGFSMFVCGAVAAKATVVVMKKYSLEDVLMAVEEYRVTRLPAVPPMVVQMIRGREVVEGYNVGSLKEVICSGAPLARDHMESFAACFPHVTLSQVGKTMQKMTVNHKSE